MRTVTGDEAVFARNHRPYLDHAVAEANRDPRKLVTFRSSQEWKSAKVLLDRQGELPIYFAIVGGGPEIVYKAWLRDAQLHPSSADVRTQELLEDVPPATAPEGLWEGNVKTLYAISGCQQPDNRSTMTDLVKLSDGKPISVSFRYSYALVNRLPETPSRVAVALDISEPRRTEVRLNRGHSRYSAYSASQGSPRRAVSAVQSAARIS